ncbi:Afi1p PWA37_005372 [Arxiozyma heterogenica]|uniref:Afi1p n=1 Tax=Arxiozyma heterogenica TaxID=278026 RepID=UPI002F10ED78
MVNGSSNRKNNIEYILFSEFDNKLGSILRYQYPNDIPVFKSINLATLMIPNNIEKCLGKVEFTYFLLYFNPTTKKYELVPSIDKMNKKLDILYFINVCIAKADPDNERGAVINSIAFGLNVPDFLKWKTLLTSLLEGLMDMLRINNIDDNNDTNLRCVEVISNFFKKVNKINFLDTFNRNLYQEIIQSFGEGINEQIIINSILQNFKNSLAKNTSSLDQVESIISNDLVYYFLPVETIPINSQYKINKIPLCQRLLLKSYIQTDIYYYKHALKIVKDISLEIVDVEEIRTIFIMSTKTSNDYLCQLVFSMSYLISGVSLNKDPAFNGIYAFPYIDISIVVLLKDFIQSLAHKKLKLIIGTTNPIFKIQDDIYDILYDLDTEKIYSSSKYKTKQTDWRKQTLNMLAKSYKINDSINSLSHGLNNIKFKSKSESSFNPLTSISNSTINNYSYNPFFSFSSDSFSPKSDHCRSVLMNSFIRILIYEQRDNKTILNVLKRIQIFQLILLLKPITIKEINVNTISALIQKYSETYNNLIYVNELFDISILKFIKMFYILYETIELLTNLDVCLVSTTSCDAVIKKINECQEIIRQSLFDISTTNAISYTRKLIYVCMNFPPLDILSHFDTRYKDFQNFDINMIYSRVAYHAHQQSSKSSSSSFQQTNSTNQNSSKCSIIDSFVKTTTFNLFDKILSVDLNLNQKYDSSYKDSVFTGSNLSFFSSPFKRRGKSTIKRSLSFRNLLSLKVNGSRDFKPAEHQNTVKEIIVTSKEQIVLKSSIPDSSISSLPSKVLKKSTSMESIRASINKSSNRSLTDSSMLYALNKKIDEVKSMVCEILRMIDDDKTLGNIIIQNYLNKQKKTQLDIYIRKYNLHKKPMSDNNNITAFRVLEKFDKNSNMSLNKDSSVSKTPFISSINSITSTYKKVESPNKVYISIDSYNKARMEEDDEEEEEEEIFYEIEYL